MSNIELNNPALRAARRVTALLALMLALLSPAMAAAEENPAQKEEESLDVKEIMFEHLLDGYGWEVPF